MREEISKSTKHEASYQDVPHVAFGDSNGLTKVWEYCQLCTMFRPPNSCTAVNGDISQRGWCRYFERLSLSSGASLPATSL